MNWFDQLYVMSFVNWLACTGIGWVCLCRMHRMSQKTRPLFVWNYAALFTGATACGWQPLLFREFAGWGDVLFAFAILSFLSSGRKAWKEQAPDYTTRREWADTRQEAQ
jgi:hypothetical protein